MRIAHISDLHFSKISFHPRHFFSKRWVGSFNLLFNRNQKFSNEKPYTLIEPLKKNNVSYLIVSGDLTTTSLKREYVEASAFIEALKKEGISTFLIPGNHDHYTKNAYLKKRFYSYFPDQFEKDKKKEIAHFSLAKQRVTAAFLGEGFWIVGMDTTLATPLSSANGSFSPQIEHELRKLLKLIPSKEQILLVNHFPLFKHEAPHRQLLRAEHLQKLVGEHPNILFYLHGHTHRSIVADLRKNQLPIVLDSGSASYAQGSWNLLDLKGSSCTLTVYHWLKESWQEVKNYQFERHM